MRPAVRPRAARDDARLLTIDRRSGASVARRIAELPALLAPGDLLVVNDAATLPASLHGRLAGADVELRLVGAAAGERWVAVVLGAGDWRIPTEHRPPPPPVAPGARIGLGAGGELAATVVARSPLSPRLVELEFSRTGAALWQALYQLGRPVQYAYLDAPLELWSVQTVYGGRPWAVEMPSAGRPLTWALLAALRRRGIELGALTHAAGLSSTGDPAIDAALPLPERYEIPPATARAIVATHRRGGRVVAVGTTVVRALESWAASGRLAATTSLRLGPASSLRAVDGILTGMHAPGESHFELLGAFAAPAALRAGFGRAEALGFETHELGDLSLIAPGLDPAGAIAA